jgi:hypothetical protein
MAYLSRLGYLGQYSNSSSVMSDTVTWFTFAARRVSYQCRTGPILGPHLELSNGCCYRKAFRAGVGDIACKYQFIHSHCAV